jgi:competence protein ComFC
MSSVFPTFDIITSVPLHKKRQNQRGFNQAEVIAKELARLLCIEYMALLVRNKETINFAKVADKHTRAELARSLFSINEKSQPLIKNKSILIVDDVWTTGATLNACSQLLETIQVSKVTAATFSHGI